MDTAAAGIAAAAAAAAADASTGATTAAGYILGSSVLSFGTVQLFPAQFPPYSAPSYNQPLHCRVSERLARLPAPSSGA